MSVNPVRTCAKCGGPKSATKSRNRYGECVAWRCIACSPGIAQSNLLPLTALVRPLPWMTPEICVAVRQGMDAPTAIKMRQFAVVIARDFPRIQYVAHVPSERLNFAVDKIVLVATLNERSRWAIRPAAGAFGNPNIVSSSSTVGGSK